MERILVVDDEKSMRDFLAIVLKKEGYQVAKAGNGAEALESMTRDPCALVLSDIRMPDMDGVELLRAVKEQFPDTVVLLITAYASADTAVEAVKLGAYDYVTKPFNVDEVSTTVRNALEKRRLEQENTLLKAELQSQFVMDGIVGKSRQMRDLFALVRRVAATNSTVLITGESGTGKELTARAIHFNSARRAHPFLSINCAALPDQLLESELFGHKQGAFTGAVQSKEGLFAAANGGTVFLDEIGETSPAMQVKLLRVLQDGRIRRVGDTREVETDVRVIAATNQDLETAVGGGQFREDLYYRINVITIHLPPLRERREDIPLLVSSFIDKYARSLSRRIDGITQEALQALEGYHWPGNIRDLENVIERAIALERGTQISMESLPDRLQAGPGAGTVSPAGDPIDPIPPGFRLEEHVEKIRRAYLLQALTIAGGNQKRAAELLGISRRSFRYYVGKYGLKAHDE